MTIYDWTVPLRPLVHVDVETGSNSILNAIPEIQPKL
jgi:hypothetical protein